MDNGFLIPANAKKGTLIFSIFLPFDLILFGTGIMISFILLAIAPTTTDLGTMLLIISPAAVAGFLVIPIPHYHNVRCGIISIYKFFTERRRYAWKGWCFYEKFANEDEDK